MWRPGICKNQKSRQGGYLAASVASRLVLGSRRYADRGTASLQLILATLLGHMIRHDLVDLLYPKIKRQKESSVSQCSPISELDPHLLLHISIDISSYFLTSVNKLVKAMSTLVASKAEVSININPFSSAKPLASSV